MFILKKMSLAVCLFTAQLFTMTTLAQLTPGPGHGGDQGGGRPPRYNPCEVPSDPNCPSRPTEPSRPHRPPEHPSEPHRPRPPLTPGPTYPNQPPHQPPHHRPEPPYRPTPPPHHRPEPPHHRPEPTYPSYPNQNPNYIRHGDRVSYHPDGATGLVTSIDNYDNTACVRFDYPRPDGAYNRCGVALRLLSKSYDYPTQPTYPTYPTEPSYPSYPTYPTEPSYGSNWLKSIYPGYISNINRPIAPHCDAAQGAKIYPVYRPESYGEKFTLHVEINRSISNQLIDLNSLFSLKTSFPGTRIYSVRANTTPNSSARTVSELVVNKQVYAYEINPGYDILLNPCSDVYISEYDYNNEIYMSIVGSTYIQSIDIELLR